MTVQVKDVRIKTLSGVDQNAAGNVRVAKDFRLELLYTVPRESGGSWVALCVDPKGRLITSDQNGKLCRLNPPPVGRSAAIEAQPIDLDIGGAHGLVYAFDSLYVMVNEGRRQDGLYRVRDTDGDDFFDEVKLLREIEGGGGEHGLHSVVLSPDGRSLYVACGDQSRPPKIESSVAPLHWSEDHLLPRLETGFMAGVLAPGGYVLKTDPEGERCTLIATVFRNQFDIAFNREGELFTYDADMEWDIGAPWYYVLALRVLKDGWTMPLSEEYFRWFVETAPAYRGGNTFSSSLRRIRDDAIETLDDTEREALKPILEATPPRKSVADLLAARPLVKEWTVEELSPIVEEGLAGGRSFERGRGLFGEVACGTCHRFARDGGGVGPDLTTVVGRFNVRDLLESIVEPSRTISDQYAAVVIVKKDGDIVTGRIANLSGEGVSVVEDMLDPGRMTSVRRSDIASMELSKVSVMPQGLLNSLKADEIRDLIAYLLSQGDPRHGMFR